MSSWPENKTASHLACLTMRLKGKLHPQRIRRSERIKHASSEKDTPPELNLQEQKKSGCVLEDQQRAVISSLQYFKALVDRLGVDRPGATKLVLDQSVIGRLLGGASSGVLEAVQTLVQLDPHLHNSETISACLTHLYLSLAKLIQWADQVMLRGNTHENKDSTASVTTMIRAVLDGVKDLVRLAAEREEGSAPLSPAQPTVGQTGGFDETSDPVSTCQGPVEEEDAKSAPPKPLMPLLLPPHQQEFSPPALPPKKRQPLSGPAPCRVAIVAPMRQEPREDSQEVDHLKPDSADNTHCASLSSEDDPDYDFLHTDLSSSETLPPLPPPSSLPPALPEKRRRSTAGTISSQAPPTFAFDSTPQNAPEEPMSSPLSPSRTPPPLPEKRRHIHQYLQVCSSYSAQPSIFYQTPPTISCRQVETGDSAPSPEQLSAPALPPKKKQQATAENDNQSGDSSQQEVGAGAEQEEVLLTNQQEVLLRITMKPEEEEGPDVKAASPEILLVYATQTDGSNDQVLFCEAFLSTYRTFISPDDVISKLQHRYRHLFDIPEHLKDAKDTFNLLVRVVDELCVMELESDLLLRLMELVFSLLIGGELGPAHLLRSNILSKMEQRWQLIDSPQSLRPLAARGVAARPGSLLDFRSQDLAEQLTLMDSGLFYKIELPEVLLWSKEQNEEKSPNLTAFTQHFNNVSFWVRSVIILQDKPQDREKLLLKFLRVMKHLRKLNNFNSYLSILSALDSAPLRRLDWQRSTAEALEEYGSLIDSSSSFRVYRAALAEVEPPCIPYLGLILQDLTFVHLGNPDTMMTSQGPKVNFSKRWQQFNILYSLRNFQQVHYSLQPHDDIILFFNDFSDHLAEEALWELSLRLRPRNASKTNQR
ncbi:rap guanine nucleotide exchange factor 1-like [Echeneis naucrates]|uniref:rap guanine nucleotide exchange factor 1-like n=1 Tax=Echeneis naucrates TaxID=173247 RepID=UPI0011133D18|nr:rap guanine nucleotide exchange factor 1 [Echeneis naucrates]